MSSSRFIIRDLEEERRHNLPDSREVCVGRFSVYRLEFFERIVGFRHDFFGHHCFQRAWLREQFGPLQGQFPSLWALIIHK